jgi:hypothetical protein
MRFKDFLQLEAFNNNVLDYYGSRITSLLGTPYATFDDIVDTIYSLLTTKTKSPQHTFVAQYGGEYSKTLASINFPNYTKSENSGWVFFEPSRQATPKTSVGKVGRAVYAVDYKRYATFKSEFLSDDIQPNNTTMNHAWYDVRCFLGMLTGLSKRLWDLGQQQNDYVQFKINNSLHGLLTHTDNIVVHYRNRQLGPEVDNILRVSAREVGVKLDGRDHRGTKGFDFSPYGTVEKSPISSGGSYSQIVARRLAKELMDKRKMLTNKTQVIDFLTRHIPDALTYGPEGTFSYFHP